MSDQMGRPKVLSDDMVRVETTVTRSDKKALAAMAAESGMSERSLLRAACEPVSSEPPTASAPADGSGSADGLPPEPTSD